jgi:hypothetical protein
MLSVANWSVVLIVVNWRTTTEQADKALSNFVYLLRVDLEAATTFSILFELSGHNRIVLFKTTAQPQLVPNTFSFSKLNTNKNAYSSLFDSSKLTRQFLTLANLARTPCRLNWYTLAN